jgi:hypothetical protein
VIVYRVLGPAAQPLTPEFDRHYDGTLPKQSEHCQFGGDSQTIEGFYQPDVIHG